MIGMGVGEGVGVSVAVEVGGGLGVNVGPKGLAGRPGAAEQASKDAASQSPGRRRRNFMLRL